MKRVITINHTNTKNPQRAVRELTEREMKSTQGGYGTNGDIRVNTPP